MSLRLSARAGSMSTRAGSVRLCAWDLVRTCCADGYAQPLPERDKLVCGRAGSRARFDEQSMPRCILVRSQRETNCEAIAVAALFLERSEAEAAPLAHLPLSSDQQAQRTKHKGQPLRSGQRRS